jgi:hypothetical protein
MPKFVDDLANELKNDPKFYPEKDEKQREGIAWAVAWSQFKKKKKKSKRKSNLELLNKVITALEDKGFDKQAEVLQDMFIKLSTKNPQK